MDLVNFIQTNQLHYAIYFLLFFGMFVDAVITVFTAIFLISVNIIAAVWSVPVLVLGIFAEQCFYFWVGRKLSHRERISRWANKAAAPFDKHLISKTFHTLLISKFVYGLHRAILIRSGMLNLPLKKFVKYSVYIAFIWFAIISCLALAFAASYQKFKNVFRYAELIPLGLVIIFLLGEWFLSRRLKQTL